MTSSRNWKIVVGPNAKQYKVVDSGKEFFYLHYDYLPEENLTTLKCEVILSCDSKGVLNTEPREIIGTCVQRCVKDDKLLIIKHRRRKNSLRRKGHRVKYTLFKFAH